MTLQDKEMLLKDLCARLPYDVKVRRYVYITPVDSIQSVELLDLGWLEELYAEEAEFKPYLFPLSSMTEEQQEEYRKACELDTEILSKHPMDGTPFPVLYNSQDWLDAHHFDYRGLIPMGLAIDATNLNIY